jgi:hypothetical protein
MAKFMKGDVVVVPFPFSDLTQAKRRPALVISAHHSTLNFSPPFPSSFLFKRS